MKGHARNGACVRLHPSNLNGLLFIASVPENDARARAARDELAWWHVEAPCHVEAHCPDLIVMLYWCAHLQAFHKVPEADGAVGAAYTHSLSLSPTLHASLCTADVATEVDKRCKSTKVQVNKGVSRARGGAAQQLPRAIRVGPNEGSKKIGAPKYRGLFDSQG